MHNDLTFFTNEPDATLLDRFRKNVEDVGLIESSPYFILPRLDIYLPKGAVIKVKLGEKVKAGETVIGEIPTGK